MGLFLLEQVYEMLGNKYYGKHRFCLSFNGS